MSDARDANDRKRAGESPFAESRVIEPPAEAPGESASAEARDDLIDSVKARFTGAVDGLMQDLIMQANGVWPDANDLVRRLARRLRVDLSATTVGEDEAFAPGPPTDADAGIPVDEQLQERRASLSDLWATDDEPFSFATTELVRLDRLPCPHDWVEHASVADRASQLFGSGDIDKQAGYGFGGFFNRRLGGGLAPGEALIVGASGAGAGKTALVGQIVDGLALRTGEMLRDPQTWDEVCRTLTPVIVLSELSVAEQRARSVSRYTGIPKSAFRQGRHWHGARVQGDKTEDLDVRRAQTIANQAIRGKLGLLREHLKLLRVDMSEDALSTVSSVKRAVDAMRYQLRAVGAPAGFSVVPVVLLDPIQRFQEQGQDEVTALNSLVEQLHNAAIDEGFIVLCTSDTNKDAASGNAGTRANSEREARERVSKLLRGSQKLQHLVECSTAVDRDYDAVREECRMHYGELELAIGKNRNGPGNPPFARFRWHLATGRMFALSEGYCARVHDPKPDPPRTIPINPPSTRTNEKANKRGAS